jgi:antitoxin component YwqK of YwqJK toxin-antitoxin module
VIERDAMQRVLASSLAYDSSEDAYYLDGKPFTGVAFTAAKDGFERSESEYRDGLRWGPTREWYAPGQPKVESNYFRGVLHGAAREWHRNGALAEHGVYEFGIAIWEKQWDENGQLTKERTLKETDSAFGRLQRLRKTYGET